MICLFLLKFKRILPLSIETKIRDYFINANFVPEICLHKYMIIKKILIIKTHISTVLLRRGSALIRNDKKTKYEL